ncbi:NACHT domain-containing protein [Rivularia sp. UHCC 0363]|uniref:NACHT domain-containing protein n=1 Tax=Rivularia sp. UHCC 0363 TaxID=3110244 RepID=UPI002B205B68|nr:NACHT domain-containing protein [Rivularia sp. UHCC 0363]MEA5595429.1 NACHT domain-containing protein [Rivularia sp. UHCC 0363]
MYEANLPNNIQIFGGVKGWVHENRGVVNQKIIIEISNILGLRTPDAAKKFTQNEYKQKNTLLNKVKNYWVQGILENSLHTKVMIELGIKEESNAVKDIFTGIKERSSLSNQLPISTGVTDIFNQMGDGRTLLILGDPGAGKTITLLKLAESLIARTELDMSRPIPVVFTLSSWVNKRQKISNWLVQELWNRYQVPKSLGKSWVKQEKILPLLDGLDEVKPELREDCVEAINQFMQKHGHIEIVVSSRIKDYEALSSQLQLQGAIRILPLSNDQIKQYLDQAGGELEAVKHLLQTDTKLHELAESPLTLSIMTLAYKGKKPEELPQIGSVEERRQHLFNTYIERRFQRKNHQYPKEQVMRWLSWLAFKMSQASQTVFLIEQIQPKWLETNQKSRYRFGSMLVGGLTILLILWPIYAWDPLYDLGWKAVEHQRGGLINALRWGIVIAPIFGWGAAEIKTYETLTWPWKKTWNNLITGLIKGLKWGLIFALTLAPLGGLWIGLTRWQAYGGAISGIEWGIEYGLKWGLSLGLCLGIIDALRGSQIETKTIPNQGIWKSASNAGITGLISWLILVPIYLFNSQLISNIYWGLIMGLGDWAKSTPIDIVTPALRWGLILGLIFGGGTACIRHFTLRLILHRNNYIPWNYAHFLNYASELVFLHKVGGGYIFIHRMLLEHFAQIYRKDTLNQVDSSSAEYGENKSLNPVQNHIYCSKCGYKNSANSHFCTNCGTSLNKIVS